MTIVVAKHWEEGAVYVARPSPLGNPFKMRTEADRDHICDRYAQWLDERVAAGDERVLKELRKLFLKHKTEGRLVLGCFCAPKRCHADAIKAFLERHL